MMNQSDVDRMARANALMHACDQAQVGDSAATITAEAEVYRKFLRGESIPTTEGTN